MAGSVSPSPYWLERANRLALTSRVLSGTVHDVNNALQVISGSAELLQMLAGAPDIVRVRGQAIGAQARRASDLLADLTAFARDARVRPEPVGLRATAERALVLRHYALTRLRVVPVIEGDECLVAVGTRHLLQTVLNLIVNAEQAMSGVGAPALRLLVSAADGTAQLSVVDNGAGLTGDVEATLFGPGPDSGDVVDDLGIGLRVSRWLAEQHGGTLHAALEPGGGMRLTLALPALRG